MRDKRKRKRWLITNIIVIKYRFVVFIKKEKKVLKKNSVHQVYFPCFFPWKMRKRVFLLWPKDKLNEDLSICTAMNSIRPIAVILFDLKKNLFFWNISEVWVSYEIEVFLCFFSYTTIDEEFDRLYDSVLYVVFKNK